MFCKFIFTLFSILCVVNSSKVLIMSLFRTHWHFFFELGHLLEEKQHEIYFLSYQNDSVFQKQNFNVYVVRPDLNLSLEGREFNEYVYQDLYLENANTMTTLNTLADWCSLFLNDSTLFNQVQTKQFDIFITDLFANDICSIAWAKNLAIPIIGIWPLSLSLPIAYHLDVPTATAVESSANSFFQRISKIAQDYSLMRKWNANYYQPVLSVINQYHTETTVNVNELHEKLVLIMTNDNPILELDKPALSNIVSLGGIHCKSPNPIPKNIEDFSKIFRGGIIFVSLDVELSKTQKEILIKTFFTMSSYAIIWQQKEKIENVPNIQTVTNINQQDILGNPRTRLFVSSCDSLGTTSAIFHSVPILCITKEPQNIIGTQVVDRKIGSQIQIDQLTRSVFLENMNKLLIDKTYYHSVRQLSVVFRDQPEIPADRFVFWIERIIRHKSTPLHQTPKSRMYSSLYYYILDVIILIVLFSMIVIGVVVAVSFVLAKLLRSKSKGKVE